MVALAVLSGAAYASDGVEKSAVEASAKIFNLHKEAAKSDAKIREICDQIFKVRDEATKNLTREQMVEFDKEFRYQMRQNMAKLPKGEEWEPGLCRGFHRGMGSGAMRGSWHDGRGMGQGMGMGPGQCTGQGPCNR